MHITLAHEPTQSIDAIVQALGKAHTVTAVPVPSVESVPSAVTDMLLSNPSVVVNLLEEPYRAATVVALLKDLGVPYTGSDARVFLLTANPLAVHRALLREHVLVTPTPAEPHFTVTLVGTYPRLRGIVLPTCAGWMRDVMETTARQVFNLFELRGYGRVQFTVVQGQPVVQQVRPAFCFMQEDWLTLTLASEPRYPQLLTDIVEHARTPHEW